MVKYYAHFRKAIEENATCRIPEAMVTNGTQLSRLPITLNQEAD